MDNGTKFVIVMMLILILSFLFFAYQDNKNEQLCIDVCESEKTYSVGYQLIDGLNDRGKLCVCYYPSISGNEIKVHLI